MGFIYKVTNKLNNKVYVGQTNYTVEKRWKQHRKDFQLKQTKLYQAMRQDGLDNFEIETLEECHNEQLSEREKYWVQYFDSFNNGYNMTRGGDGKHLRDYQNIIKVFQQTFNINQTCKECGCSRDTVKRAMLAYNIDFVHPCVGVQVCRIDPKSDEIKVYSSIRQAALDVNPEKFQTTRKRINYVLLHKPEQKAYGYYWRKL